VKCRCLNVRCDDVVAAITITDNRLWQKRMVYVVRASKKIRYPGGRSRIVYIGETGKGKKRPASSAISKAERVFKKLRGMRFVTVHLVTCRGKNNVRTWEILEQSLLATFNSEYKGLPHYNQQGKKFVVSPLFRKQRLLSVLQDLS
jgi:hypothetical protein